MKLRILVAVASLALSGCVGSTGSSLFTFDAAAAGPSDAAHESLTFDTPRGFHVSLSRAKFHIGAAYLLTSVPLSGAGNTDCIIPAAEDSLVYVSEVTRGLEVDALDPRPQRFPGQGEAIAQHAVAAEVWLFKGDINQVDDDAPVLELAGTAEAEGQTYPFEGTITIGRNRLPPVVNPAEPSAHPICKERIVTGIPTNVTPAAGGSLELTIHPEGLFTNVDFSALRRVSDNPPLFAFRDDNDDPPSLNLYRGLQAREGVYAFGWVSKSTKEVSR